MSKDNWFKIVGLKTFKKKEYNGCVISHCRNKQFMCWLTIDGEYYPLCKKHSVMELKRYKDAWLTEFTPENAINFFVNECAMDGNKLREILEVKLI